MLDASSLACSCKAERTTYKNADDSACPSYTAHHYQTDLLYLLRPRAIYVFFLQSWYLKVSARSPLSLNS